MTKKNIHAFTLIEMLVVIAIIATIAAFALPAITGALTRGQLAQAVSNARQVHLATFSMTTDGTQTGDAKYGWPGDLFAATDANVKIANVSEFVQRLVDNDYLKPGDLKVFATAGITPWTGTYTAPPDANSKGTLAPAFDATKNCAFKVYKVTEKMVATHCLWPRRILPTPTIPRRRSTQPKHLSETKDLLCSTKAAMAPFTKGNRLRPRRFLERCQVRRIQTATKIRIPISCHNNGC